MSGCRRDSARRVSLDFVLDHPEWAWLPTEQEKLDCFQQLEIERAFLSFRIYSGHAKRQIRCFPLRMPVAMGPGAAVFVYIDPGMGSRTELDCWIHAHRPHWQALRECGWRIEVISTYMLSTFNMIPFRMPWPVGMIMQMRRPRIFTNSSRNVVDAAGCIGLFGIPAIAGTQDDRDGLYAGLQLGMANGSPPRPAWRLCARTAASPGEVHAIREGPTAPRGRVLGPRDFAVARQRQSD